MIARGHLTNSGILQSSLHLGLIAIRAPPGTSALRFAKIALEAHNGGCKCAGCVRFLNNVVRPQLAKLKGGWPGGNSERSRAGLLAEQVIRVDTEKPKVLICLHVRDYL